MAAAPVPQLLHLSAPVLGVPFHVLITPEDGVVRAAGFATATDPHVDNLRARLREREPALAARAPSTLTPQTELTGHESAAAVVDALQQFDRGSLAALTTVASEQRETPFRGDVWRELRRVTPGAPLSYTELAARAGRPSAVRAAASACANNLLALFVPCHRIVRGDGHLGGYLFGTELKRRLLAHEVAHSGANPSLAR